ncbi:MAG: hypothetical protein H6822_11190 [Planctomycetaceae bacterium]|nr:hypothetical protein [Planctomycetales bacterium]MCB9922739.1 hypothetical protein [Planctomycetaceae bacterium]
MNDRTREQLLGYLLDALDDAERLEVEQQLIDNPELHDELESLALTLEPLADAYEEFEPPARLAERTCSLIAACTSATPAGKQLQPATRAEIRGGNRWSIADVVVMAGVCLAGAMLFFPAISQSRYAARLQACQNNLRELGIALVDFSEKAGRGHFPEVPTEGNRAVAGIYAPVLVDAGYLADDTKIICPSSALAKREHDWALPTLDEIDQASGRTLVLMQSSMGGSYGYNLGVVVNGRHRAPRNLGRTNFALMSDAPSLQLAGHRSANHGGRGENILYEDGHIRYVVESNVASDDPFVNRLGWMEAGLDINDSVVAPSFTPPFVNEVSYIRH